MAGRRFNGEGSVYRRASDGRWVGAVSLGYDAQGKLLRKTVSACTKADALAKVRKVQRQLDDGLRPPDDRMTLSQLLDRWFDEVMRHRVAPAAFDNYRSIAKLHLEPTLGRKVGRVFGPRHQSETPVISSTTDALGPLDIAGVSTGRTEARPGPNER